jgi:hypothetical protein
LIERRGEIVNALEVREQRATNGALIQVLLELRRPDRAERSVNVLLEVLCVSLVHT